jgi:hypothetical protein
MTETHPRQPSGTPTGGEWARRTLPETGTSLDPNAGERPVRSFIAEVRREVDEATLPVRVLLLADVAEKQADTLDSMASAVDEADGWDPGVLPRNSQYELLSNLVTALKGAAR